MHCVHRATLRVVGEHTGIYATEGGNAMNAAACRHIRRRTQWLLHHSRRRVRESDPLCTPVYLPACNAAWWCATGAVYGPQPWQASEPNNAVCVPLLCVPFPAASFPSLRFLRFPEASPNTVPPYHRRTSDAGVVHTITVLTQGAEAHALTHATPAMCNIATRCKMAPGTCIIACSSRANCVCVALCGAVHSKARSLRVQRQMQKAKDKGEGKGSPSYGAG